MDAFVWDERYMTGEHIVDSEHQQLVSIINRVVEQVSNETPESEINEILSQLVNYAVVHFRHEEELMAESGCDPRFIAAHTAVHREFASQVVKMREFSGAGSGTEDLLRFLTSWLAHHILGIDQAMARQIRKIRAGEQAEAVYLEEKKRADDPTTSSLLDAMKSLYRLIAVRNDSLQKLNENLENQVLERTQELSKTNSVLLQEKAHLKSAMAQVEITQKKLFESEHKRNEAGKRHMELFLAQIIDGDPVPTFVIDAKHRVTHWNRACAAISGQASGDVVGTDLQWRPFYASPRPTLADLIVNGSLDEQFESYYHGLVHRSKTITGAFEAESFFPDLGQDGRWLFFTAVAIRDAAGQVIGAIETLQDMTERRRAEAALRDSQVFLSEIVDGSSVATLVINQAHQVTHWNHACEILTGTLAKDVVGTNCQWRAFYPSERPIMADLVLDGAQEFAVDRLYHGRFKPSELVFGGYEAEDFFPHFGKGGRWLFFTAAPLRNTAGQVVGAIETLQDVSERRRAEEALRESEERYRKLSVTDSLTGLFNSRHMHERLQAEVERAERYIRPLSLMVLDADHFKQINDTYGHLFGDTVLQGLAHVIRECLRRTDNGFRYGGEEFVILLPEAPIASAIALAERLRQSFSEMKVRSDQQEDVSCTISIGVAEFRKGETARQLLQRADEATYRAKHNGRNRVVAAR